MALSFLLDEHLRGPIWRAIERHNATGGLFMDVVRVGDPDDLPIGTKDPQVLSWAERENRILITEDKNTMAGHLADHLSTGGYSPGVLNVRTRFSIRELVGHLKLVAFAGNPEEYENSITFIP